MEIKSIFHTYNVDFTKELPTIGTKDVLAIDKNVLSLYKDRYSEYKYVFEIEAREDVKNITTVLKLVDYLVDIGFTKKDTLHVVVSHKTSLRCVQPYSREVLIGTLLQPPSYLCVTAVLVQKWVLITITVKINLEHFTHQSGFS